MSQKHYLIVDQQPRETIFKSRDSALSVRIADKARKDAISNAARHEAVSWHLGVFAVSPESET